MPQRRDRDGGPAAATISEGRRHVPSNVNQLFDCRELHFKMLPLRRVGYCPHQQVRLLHGDVEQ